MERDGRRDDHEVELGGAGGEEFAAVGENANPAVGEAPARPLGGEGLGARVASGDQAGQAQRLQLEEGVMMDGGEAAHADDGDPDGGMGGHAKRAARRRAATPAEMDKRLMRAVMGRRTVACDALAGQKIKTV